MTYGPWAIPNDPRATRGTHDRAGDEFDFASREEPDWERERRERPTLSERLDDLDPDNIHGTDSDDWYPVDEDDSYPSDETDTR